MVRKISTVWGSASLGQVDGLALVSSRQLGLADISVSFAPCMTTLMLIVMIVPKQRLAMQPQYHQP